MSLQPGRDATIYAEGTALANGAGTYLFAGNTNRGNERRALLWFDVASAVPAGSTITSAALTLNISKARGGNSTVSLHRLTQTWPEGPSDASGQEGQGAQAAQEDTTWSRRGGLSWNTQGGDHVPDASAIAQVGSSGKVGWSSNDNMIADVQGWLDFAAGNAGWILIGTPGNQTAKRFDSRESNVGSNAPLLTIEYTQ